MRHIVYLREVWVQAYEVEAGDKDEALQKVFDGDGHSIDGDFEFSHTPDDMTKAEHHVEVAKDQTCAVDGN